MSAAPGKVVNPPRRRLLTHSALRQKQYRNFALCDLPHDRFHAPHAWTRTFHEVQPHRLANPSRGGAFPHSPPRARPRLYFFFHSQKKTTPPTPSYPILT